MQTLRAGFSKAEPKIYRPAADLSLLVQVLGICDLNCCSVPLQQFVPGRGMAKI